MLCYVFIITSVNEIGQSTLVLFVIGNHLNICESTFPISVNPCMCIMHGYHFMNP
jgi:hypothetical protein